MKVAVYLPKMGTGADVLLNPFFHLVAFLIVSNKTNTVPSQNPLSPRKSFPLFQKPPPPEKSHFFLISICNLKKNVPFFFPSKRP